MKHNEPNLEASLKRAVTEMRAEAPGSETIEAASERVWQSLRQEGAVSGAALQRDKVATVYPISSIRGCQDVSSLLPAYHARQLPAGRALLVEAHLRECAACRSEAEGARVKSPVPPWRTELPLPANHGLRWGAVAALVLAGLALYFAQSRFLGAPAGMRARVESFTGAVYRVGLSGEQSLKPGDELAEGERVRTGSDSRAMLRLADGSHLEMNERAELGVSIGRRDTTIRLGRGVVIVQAAKRQSGHLYVTAKDCRVSVTGTVFSVNSGIKGSRVSVIEGEVRVASAGATSVLHSGDQLSTDTNVDSVPVKQEIAWSQNLDEHLALLAEFSHLAKKLEAVQMPGLRYQSKILPLLPATTVLYASIPNLGDAAQQARQLFQQELDESQVLRDWWQRAQTQNAGHGFPIYDALDFVHQLGGYLGDEIVFSMALQGNKGNRGTPLIIAPVQRSGLKTFIDAEVSRHASAGHTGIQVIEEGGSGQQLGSLPATPEGSRNLLVLVRPDFVVASTDATVLRNFDAILARGGAGFDGTAFGQRMMSAYQQGAGLLFGANLQAMAAQAASASRNAHPHHQQTFQQSGFADVQFLVAERREMSGHPLNHAEMTFNGARHGIASWLAAPAPIGGLDFVSKDAGAVAAFVAKNPSQMLDDAFNLSSAADPNAMAKVNEVESDLKIAFHQDLADTLGGEITFALDGPILPTPSWKIVVEVYNPERLQSTLQQLVADANQHAQAAGEHVTLEQAAVNGLTYYSLSYQEANQPIELDYAFVDGYWIVAPSRALVMNAVNIHQNGSSLGQSGILKPLLPQDENADVSALVYQNLAPLVGPVMQQLSPTAVQALQQIAAETTPSVVCAYGASDSIRVASTSRFFGLDLNTAALSTLLRLAQPRKGEKPDSVPPSHLNLFQELEHLKANRTRNSA